MNPLIFGILLIFGNQFLGIVQEIGAMNAFRRELNQTAPSSEDLNFSLPDELDELLEMASRIMDSELGILAVADVNNDEKLTYDEIHNMARKTGNSSSEEYVTSAEMQSMFNDVDKNHDGFLTPDEVNATKLELSSEELWE
jgi:hypothetical protein